MIREINIKLKELQDKIANKKRLEKLYEELDYQKDDLHKKVKNLKKIKLKEDGDVKKIEGVSLQAILYSIRGNKSEIIDKEKREAYAATLKYDMAVRELDDICIRLDEIEDEIHSLDGVDEEYVRVLDKKIDCVKSLSIKEAYVIREMEVDKLDMQKELKEVEEAIEAGEKAYSKAKEALIVLNKAHSYGTYDIFGGGTLTSMIKHSHLDNAQVLIEGLQRHLRNFKTELVDVNMGEEIDINVQVSGFSRVADWFFDGLIVDISIQNHISDSISKVENIILDIGNILDKLKSIEYDDKKHIEEIQDNIDNIVLEI